MNNYEKYALLLIKKGVALQKGQELVLSVPVESAEFAHTVIKTAWECGAKDVIVLWYDSVTAKYRYKNADDSLLADKERFRHDTRLAYSKRGAAFLSLIGDDPDAFADIKAEKIALESKTKRTVLKPYLDMQMSNELRWCIGAVATVAWAKKIFPDVENATDCLWDKIFKTVRVYDDDPLKAWDVHHENLQDKVNWLNEMQFSKLHYKNSLGTDFTVEMPKNHMWIGGGEKDAHGVMFFANMPTEEIFCLPDRRTANGKLVAALPLYANGTEVSDFSIEFKDGKVTNFTAKKGSDTLKSIIDTDEGSHYLGEIALVPSHSPISDMGILFYETLFDENAACHFALGDAYHCFSDADSIDENEMKNRGMNTSLEHTDFMVGTKDLEITGIDKDGNTVDIFVNGNWA